LAGFAKYQPGNAPNGIEGQEDHGAREHAKEDIGEMVPQGIQLPEVEIDGIA
jgi:hypothetical protein